MYLDPRNIDPRSTHNKVAQSPYARVKQGLKTGRETINIIITEFFGVITAFSCS